MLAIAMKFCSAGSHSVKSQVQGELHNNLGTIAPLVSCPCPCYMWRGMSHIRSRPLQLENHYDLYCVDYFLGLAI